MNANVTLPTADPRFDPSREIRAPRGTQLHCKTWLAEAAYRMLQNNLDARIWSKHSQGAGGVRRHWPRCAQLGVL